MALIDCPECWSKFSDQAPACPKCGWPNPNYHPSNHNYQSAPNIPNGSIESRNKDSNKVVWIIIAITLITVIVSLIFLMISFSSSHKKIDTSSLQLTGIPSESLITVENAKLEIDNFEYSIENDVIKLNKYKGEADTLVIKASYTIDDVSYRTDLLDFQISNRKIQTVIFDEGITEVKTSIFNGCSGINKIYFPLSMSVIYDYTLAYLHPDESEKVQIYYAGTEDDWNNIFTEYTHIVNADGLGESAGQAAADFVNGFMGVEYDATQFQYYFSASLNDVN